MKTKEEITTNIKRAWQKSRSIKMDWIGLEDCIRNILEAKKEGAVNSDEALTLIDESVAAWTLRGHTL